MRRQQVRVHALERAREDIRLQACPVSGDRHAMLHSWCIIMN
jgi:hypothetical protein